jgi:hypothetical protein
MAWPSIATRVLPQPGAAVTCTEMRLLPVASILSSIAYLGIRIILDNEGTFSLIFER